jgi:dipeptidyl aminopeptidase/acylaminoacyl peptidase
VEQLRKQGVYFEQLVFPDEVHGFLLHKNWLSAYRAAADFFSRMLEKNR